MRLELNPQSGLNLRTFCGLEIARELLASLPLRSPPPLAVPTRAQV